MKKLLSGVLSLIMIVTFATPTFAVNFDAVENTKSFIYNGQGEFIASGLNLSSMQKENNISSLNKGEHIIAMPTDDSEIYMILNSDKYLVACSENKYLLCDKIDIDIQNFSNNLENFDLYNVSDYLRNDMQNVILEQNALGNEDFKIELYAPSIIDSDVISLQNDEPLGTRYYSYYYDGVYTNMKDYSVKYSDLSTGMIKKEGTSTVDVAKDFVSLIITSAGGIYEVVNAFGSFAGVAMSAYDLFENAYGEVINGTADDYISTNIIYSRIVKETYAQDPVYGDFPNVGCVSHKVWIDHNETYQYYRSKGQGQLTNTYIGKTIYSEHFQNPAPIAIDNGISATEFDFPLTTEIYGQTVRFTGQY